MDQQSPRPQSGHEEVANTISHGVGLLAAITACPFLIAAAVQRGHPAGIVGVCIFSFAMIVLYLTSTLYHALPRGGAKNLFQILDHMAIYLMIAGTYTPFTLGVLEGAWSWTLFGIIWSLALAGILLKSIVGTRYMMLSTALYVIMGWGAIIAIKPLWNSMSAASFAWLIAGGIVYTLGVFFFILDHRIRYSHFVWHLFVISGTACHFVAILGHAR